MTDEYNDDELEYSDELEQEDDQPLVITEPTGNVEGIPEKKFNAVHKMLSNDRRHFGRPGANLTLLDDPDVKEKLGKDWKCDTLDDEMKAKVSASNAFMDWMNDKPEAVLVDSVHVDGVDGDVSEDTGLMDVGYNDSVLIVGNHVLIIDVKAFKGGKSEDSVATYMQDDDGVICKGRKPVPGGSVRIESDLQNWFDYIQYDDENPINLLGMVYLDSDNIKVSRLKAWWDMLMHHFWCLIEKGKLNEQLDKWYDQISDDEKHMINTDLITQIVVKMVKPYDRRAHVINMKPLHLQS